MCEWYASILQLLPALSLSLSLSHTHTHSHSHTHSLWLSHPAPPPTHIRAVPAAHHLPPRAGRGRPRLPQGWRAARICLRPSATPGASYCTHDTARCSSQRYSRHSHHRRYSRRHTSYSRYSRRISSQPSHLCSQAAPAAATAANTGRWCAGSGIARTVTRGRHAAVHGVSVCMRVCDFSVCDRGRM